MEGQSLLHHKSNEFVAVRIRVINELIDASTQLTWPTETDFATPSRLRECPVYRIPT